MISSETTSSNRAFADRSLSRRRALGVGTALAASTLIGPAMASARQATPLAGAELSARIDAVVAQIMEQTGVPGLAVGVVHNDQVVHLAGYGVREAGLPDPIDPDTVFQLASVSKCLASTTVAAVVGDEMASWDDVVHELDPNFELPGAWETHAATVRDLFSHRTGLPDHAGDLLEDIGYSKEEVIARLRFFNPVGPFRASYNYTNFGLSAAAYAVAAKVGFDWNDLAKERVYDRLGMTNTSSRFADYLAHENRAIPHQQIEPGVWQFVEQRQPDAQTPAGGVSSSASDMTRFLRMLLGNGMVDGEEIVAKAALGQTLTPHAMSNAPGDPFVERTGFYGLGWNTGVNNEGQPTFNHSGAFALGASTFAGFNPTIGVGAVVLTNSSPVGAAESIGLTIMDLLTVGEAPTDYLPFLQAVFEEELRLPYDRGIDFDVQPEGFTESLPLSTFVGEYASDLLGVAGVSEADGGLVLELGPNRTPYPMTHFTGEQFSFMPPGENAGVRSLVMFSIGPDGLANRVTIDYFDKTGQGTLSRVTDPA